MHDILSDIQNQHQQGKKLVLATVIQTWRSAPRQIGATMLVSEDNFVAGSVSGGCIEGSVIKASKEVLDKNEALVLEFGVSNDEAWSVGLSCGGRIKVLLKPFFNLTQEEDIWQNVQENIQKDKGFVLLRKLEEKTSTHSLINSIGEIKGNPISNELKQLGLEALGERRSQIIEYEKKQYFAEIFPSKEKMLIIGASHIAIELIALANRHYFETIVIDPRKIFTEKTRFVSQPKQILASWPQEALPNWELDESFYAVLLTHDPKIDDAALHTLLKSKIAYIGCLGSRKTHQKRVNRLQEVGFSEKDINRIFGPVGLNIDAKNPQEIALSIMAQIIQIKNKKNSN